jgi:hypothetical protein
LGIIGPKFYSDESKILNTDAQAVSQRGVVFLRNQDVDQKNLAIKIGQLTGRPRGILSS